LELNRKATFLEKSSIKYRKQTKIKPIKIWDSNLLNEMFPELALKFSNPTMVTQEEKII
jgi:hypothetical protein